MKTYHERTFRQLVDYGSAALFCNLELANCVFNNCGLSLTESVKLMARVRNVSAIGCKCISCHIGPAMFEDVLIDGLVTYDELALSAPLFRRVTLRGNIGRLRINPSAAFAYDIGEAQHAFDTARHAFYKDVDWALDISEARFLEFDMDGVPARLVRRDPATQVVVTRERASQSGWRKRLSAKNTFWPFVISLFLEDGHPDIVLVAPKRAPKKEFNNLVAGLNELRRLGVAEPD